MSRVAKKPVALPSGAEVKINGQSVEIQGSKGVSSVELHPAVCVEREGSALLVASKTSRDLAMAGTMRALLHNAVVGATQGFEKKLTLTGVGYRAQVQSAKLVLTLGYSHPIEYPIPQGIGIETPSQTEIIVRGVDKYKVGQVAAEIRAYRPPEPYKGKGVCYHDERIVRKEAKKK